MKDLKHRKILGLMVVTTGALMVFGAVDASATTLEVSGVSQNKAVSVELSLKFGTSLILKDEFGTTTDTCTTSLIKSTTASPYTGASVGGPVSALTVSNCTHTSTTLATGSLSVSAIAGTTNGTVSSSGAEITFYSTFFGASGICKTGSGTDLGTLTGMKSGNATIDLNATVSCGILGNSRWTGTYTFTGPEGLGVGA